MVSVEQLLRGLETKTLRAWIGFLTLFAIELFTILPRTCFELARYSNACDWLEFISFKFLTGGGFARTPLFKGGRGSGRARWDEDEA